VTIFDAICCNIALSTITSANSFFGFLLSSFSNLNRLNFPFSVLAARPHAARSSPMICSSLDRLGLMSIP
jgi:hypothetical protein